MAVIRDGEYTYDDFITTQTPTGRHTVRWKHNNRALETFSGYNSRVRAKRFIEFLVKQLNSERIKQKRH